MAGKSLLVHQDFVYPYYPWLPISIESWSDYFKFFDYAEHSTAIYRVKRSSLKPTAFLSLVWTSTCSLLSSTPPRIDSAVGRRDPDARKGAPLMAEGSPSRVARVAMPCRRAIWQRASRRAASAIFQATPKHLTRRCSEPRPAPMRNFDMISMLPSQIRLALASGG